MEFNTELPPSQILASQTGNSVPLTPSQTELWIRLVMIESEGLTPEIPENELPFTAQVLRKRVEVCGLPIKFTTTGLIAVDVLCEGNPGKAVALLIDCLQKDPSAEVNMDFLSHLYPNGFYSPEAFASKVDTELKPKKVRWSELY